MGAGCSTCCGAMGFMCCQLCKCRLRCPCRKIKRTKNTNPAVDLDWENVKCWMQWWAIFTPIVLVIDFLVSHGPITVSTIAGDPQWWSDCGNKAGCIATNHMLLIPFAYLLVVVYYFFAHFTKDTANIMAWLLGFANADILTYAFLESNLLLDILRPGATPWPWEWPLRLLLCVLLYGGLTWSLWTNYVMVKYVLKPGNRRFMHPSSIGEVKALVHQAIALKAKIRVVGSGHSAPGSKIGTNWAYNDPSDFVIPVMLDQLRDVTFYPTDAKVYADYTTCEAQGGCNLGKDPGNDSSTQENSLCQLLNDRGFGLPDLGGIVHQTVAGFLATGSAGGTLQHDLGECIKAFRIVDGKGKERLIDREKQPDDFAAVGVNMGLFGIVVGVVFDLKKCGPKYLVRGDQVTIQLKPEDGKTLEDDGLDDETRPRKDMVETDIFNQAKLEAFLTKVEYSRFMWWPQTPVSRVVFWTANRTNEDLDTPYVEIPAPRITGALLNKIYSTMRIQAANGGVMDDKTANGLCDMLRLFNGVGSMKPFGGWWHEILPMDNNMPDDTMGVDFLELWVDLKHAAACTNFLLEHFRNHGQTDQPVHENVERTGTFCYEMYATKKSAFWMSPSFAGPKFRIDVFWLRTDVGRPDEFFAGILKVFAANGMQFNFHRGKYLGAPNGPFGRVHMQSKVNNKMFNEWNAKRKEYDPEDIFLTHYWNTHLIGSNLSAPAGAGAGAGTGAGAGAGAGAGSVSVAVGAAETKASPP